MIESIEIQNFRCFERLKVNNCRRFNVIVGDNGAGKTALLEALFLTLSGNVEVSLRLKASRGFDTTFSGPPRAIEEAIWRDYFFNFDWTRPIAIRMTGAGPAARGLTISRGPADVLIPFAGFDQKEAGSAFPLNFDWQDAAGAHHVATPRIGTQGIQFGISSEDLPDFFLFASNQTNAASENAARFSELSRNGSVGAFVEVFTNEYKWIRDLNIEVMGGVPAIHATLRDTGRKLPLNAVSGGINRILGVMLAVASRSTSVVLVDEIEDGLYYKHKGSLWRGLLNLSRNHGSQMFLTTHDEEWLQALFDAVDDMDDIALWRIERAENGSSIVRQFTGAAVKSTVAVGGEVR